jgi:hypothetical protein
MKARTLPVTFPALLLAGLLVASGPARGQGPILGTRPSYGEAQVGVKAGFAASGPLQPVPGGEAVTRLIWVPGLDEGFVPQGLTIAEGQILVAGSGYRGVERNKGPSGVYRVHPESGRTTGWFSLPDGIQHPGGLAYAGKGVLYVANFGSLTKLNLPVALADGHSRNALMDWVEVDKRMGPSFLSYDGGFLWFGRYIRMGRPMLYKLDPEFYFGHPERDVTPETVKPRFRISLRTQGATFGPDGHLWLSQSGPDYGRLQKVDPRSGKVLREFPMPAGIEDLSFTPDGALWSASEAGAKRYINWETFFPVLFRLDVPRLESMSTGN